MRIGKRRGSREPIGITVPELTRRVERVADDLGASARTEIVVEHLNESPFGPFRHSDIRIRSERPATCPITITLFEEGSAAGCVTVSFGKNYKELWGLSPSQTLASTESLVRAIMEGQYTEWIDSGGGQAGGVVTAGNIVLYDARGGLTDAQLLQQGYERVTFGHY